MSNGYAEEIRNCASGNATRAQLQTTCKLAADKIDELEGKMFDRTIALQHAIGHGQEQHLPSEESVNLWRAALGWRPVDFLTIQVEMDQ